MNYKILPKNKKAASMGFKFLVVLVITMIFVLIYLLWLRDYRIFGENLADYAICKNSNLENAKLRLKIPLSNELLDERAGNKCKTEYLRVAKDRELEIISKKMAQCWDMYLEGKERLFETEDNNYCAVCSVLEFEDKKQLVGLTDYLIRQPAQNQQGKTYFQYLTRIKFEKDVQTELESSHLKQLDRVDTSKPLAVIFTMEKNAYPGSWTGYSSLRTGTVSGIAGGVLAGSLTAGVITCAGLTLGLCGGLIVAVVGTATLSGAAIGGTAGYAIGSTYNPDTDTKILLWPYNNQDLQKLDCTMLEGKDSLEIKKF
ncbi:glycine zipper family protein [Candidatus Woesearchaeota archaeon]|nr:glycine zipper family protein [Candidatus Woesearchaeota archaeon]